MCTLKLHSVIQDNQEKNCLVTVWSECCRLTKPWTVCLGTPVWMLQADKAMGCVFGYTVVWMLQVGLCVWGHCGLNVAGWQSHGLCWVHCGLNVAGWQSHGLCLGTLWSECCRLTKPWAVCLGTLWSECCRLTKPWAVCLGTLWSECCRLGFMFGYTVVLMLHSDKAMDCVFGYPGLHVAGLHGHGVCLGTLWSEWCRLGFVFGYTVVWMMQVGLCVWVHCGLNVAGWQSHGLCLGTLWSECCRLTKPWTVFGYTVVWMLQVDKAMDCVWVHCDLNVAGWQSHGLFGYTVVWMLSVDKAMGCVWVHCGLNVAGWQSHGLCLGTLWSECCRLIKPWAVCLGTLWSECCRLTKPWTVCLGTPWHMTSVPETGSSRMGDSFCWARPWMGSVLWDLPLWWRKIWRVGYCAFQSLTSEDIKPHIITKTAWH